MKVTWKPDGAFDRRLTVESTWPSFLMSTWKSKADLAVPRSAGSLGSSVNFAGSVLAGDHVAEALTRLKRRQSAAALTALAQAESALGRALRAESRDEDEREAVRETLKGLETAERSIQRGALTEAATQLVALNRKVDAIGTRPKVNANIRP